VRNPSRWQVGRLAGLVVCGLAAGSGGCNQVPETTEGLGDLRPQPRQAALRQTELPAGPYLVVLGTAQDGGDPQAGDGNLAKWSDRPRRDPTSLGLVDPRSEQRWLFEATPELAHQLVALDRVAPRESRPGLDGVFLTHAHVGHYTGLLFFGFEVMGTQGLPVFAMPEMAEFLRRNGPWSQLVDLANITLQPLVAEQPVALRSDLRITPILVPHRREFSETVAFRIEGPHRKVLFLPDINSWREWDALGVRVEDQIALVDVAYLDGTFWNHGEIPGRDMSTFPHPMIKESLERFAPLPSAERAKVRWIHLNHTNPAATEGSVERREIEAAGMQVAGQGEILAL
jgi:pyrroloquinoline quinone biosynthesis protein B